MSKKTEGIWQDVSDGKTRNWEAKEKGLVDKIDKISHLEGLVREVKTS